MIRLKFSILLFLLIPYYLIAQNLRAGGDYVPNQIIIKLKDDETIKSAVLKQNKIGVNNELDNYLKANKAKNVERVFSETGFVSTSSSKANLKFKPQNIILVSFDKEIENIYSSIEYLKKLPQVEYAEPNYYYGIDYTLNQNDYRVTIERSLGDIQSYAVAPSDPLFSQQSGIQSANIQKAWEVTKGDSSVVIGVIDTGVDWQHPDLDGNIWINKAELNGKEGVDDDNNGYVDDVRGWDWINNDNNPTDDNSHGTHVAGIIAARGDNKIGITGVNWYGKIMCLKVMQSTGRGDAATIAKGVEYAAANGAKIINLSLGGYFESLTLKSALEKAYAKCFIVAAAGNDGRCIGPGPGCAAIYPGSTSFILGVQDQERYSNYDQDGPFESKYADLLNYDVYAPGSAIMSTVPNGSYKSFTGTSMSTPFVAGVASLYISKNKTYDKEFLFGHLINTSSSFVDAYKVLADSGKPKLIVSKYEILDTCATCDKDGNPDAGENVNIRLYIKNTWAKADSVSFKLSHEPLADKTLVQFINDSSFVGSISPNATTYSLKGNNIKISDNVFNGADYKINIIIKDNKGNSWSDQIVITFQNAVTFGGILTSDYTLKPNKLYLVTENLIIDNCKLTILPGSTLNFAPYKAISTSRNGIISAIGKPDSLITLTANVGWTGISSSGNYYGTKIINWSDTVKNTTIFKYCKFVNLQDNWSTGGLTERSQIKGGVYIRCSFEDSRFWNSQVISNTNTTFYQCNFINNRILTNGESGNSDFSNQINNNIYYPTWTSKDYNLVSGTANDDKKMNVFNNQFFDLFSGFGGSIKELTKTKYLGTDDSLQLSKQIMDYFDNSNYNPIVINNFLVKPIDSCPGVVWKIDLNGKALSSYGGKLEDVLEPSVHELKIYFSRPMDTTIKPLITFGQRSPYNQVSINKTGKWSNDSLAYIIKREFTITDPKGIVNFSISGAVDNIGMEIPYERTRFRVNLQSSGSKSLNFGLTPQCGKIALSWDNLRTSGSDIIGYNIYRRKKLSESSWSQYALLNNRLVLDNFYTDYKASLDTTYEYVYNAVRGGLSNETDSSYVVSGKALSSKLADANGDSTVNISDVVTAVNYILLKDPLPFVFKQSDLNNDGKINILDIIGIVDRVLNPGSSSYANPFDYNSIENESDIFLFSRNDTLFARSSKLLSGIEIDANLISIFSNYLSKWEKVNMSSGKKMLFSLGEGLDINREIPIGIMKEDFRKNSIVFSSSSGRPLNAVWLGTAASNTINVSDNVSVSELYPNPTTSIVNFTINVKTPVSNSLIAEIFDISGKSLNKYNLGLLQQGSNIKKLDLGQNPKGVYNIRFYLNDQGKKLIVSKRIILSQ